MNKKRTIILLGAGAVYDWGGPKTHELTDLVRKSGFDCNDNKTKITEFIFQSLVKSGYNEKDVNFETIINVIEELIIYYSSFDKEKRTSSLQKIFFCSSFEEILLNFSIEGGVEKHGFNLEIPKCKRYEWQHRGAINGETPEQCFFQQLLAHILTDINKRIAEYAYHDTEEVTKIVTPENSPINSLFIKWIKVLNHDENILRFYTLNYERNFKILALSSGIKEIFEGFDCGGTLISEDRKRANIPRILKDFDCHCHYNLHCSAFWEIETRDNTLLPNAEFFLRGFTQLQTNSGEQAYIQI